MSTPPDFVKNSPAAVDTGLVDRGQDHTVPLEVTREVYAMYAKGDSDKEFGEFEGRGHSLTIDNGWRDVTLQWLTRKGF
ncbi:hypothetical protein [Mycolicibacterium chubuense]|uniref:hypothetical protein n=1 Tax=Mycolicibacterium chubuense TaxID=1800 RepID=UPI000310643C|nr:hypothetical protein [Mycolicibacterium chubuense]